MIHVGALAQSREVYHDLPSQLENNESAIHRLGGLSRAQSLKEPTATTSTGQQVFITYSSSNPFYHIHQALHQQPPKTQPPQKCFQDVIRQVHEMREICQKLLTPQKEKQEYQKTLIMDLQKLQTNRTDLQNDQSQPNESQISIKEQLCSQSRFCVHGKCDEINEILEKALKRLEYLEQDNSKLEKYLIDQKISKKMAENENLYLRQEIARIDEEKCEQVKKLKQEIVRLKSQKQNGMKLVPIQEIGRVPVENVSQKFIQRVQPNQRPVLAAIQVEQNLKASQVISVSHSHDEGAQKVLLNKLKHSVYL